MCLQAYPYIRPRLHTDNSWKAKFVDCHKVPVVYFMEHLFGNLFRLQARDSGLNRFLALGQEVSFRFLLTT